MDLDQSYLVGPALFDFLTEDCGLNVVMAAGPKVMGGSYGRA